MNIPNSFKPKQDSEKNLKELLNYHPKENLERLQEEIMNRFSKDDELLEYHKYSMTSLSGEPFSILMVTAMDKENKKRCYMPSLEFRFLYSHTILIPKSLEKMIKHVEGIASGWNILFQSKPNSLLTHVTFPATKDMFLIRNYPEEAEHEEIRVNKGDKNLVESIEVERNYKIGLNLHIGDLKRYEAVIDVNHPSLEKAVLEAHETFKDFSKKYKFLEPLHEKFNDAGRKRFEMSQSIEYTNNKKRLHHKLVQEMIGVLKKYKIELK